MSLFLHERIDEQIEDPVNDKITFAYPWIIEMPQVEVANDEFRITNRFGTNYENGEASWFGVLSFDRIGVHSIASYHNEHGPFSVWKGTCYVSYSLYSTNELHSEFYTSPKLLMLSAPNRDSFKTVRESMAAFSQAVTDKAVFKIIIYIELILPAKLFYCPYERSSLFINRKRCCDLPANIDGDFRFEFLKNSDFTIKCPDGVMPCRREVLYFSSRFMRKHLLLNFWHFEFVTDFTVDVIKPLVLFLHSFCFTMPETYDLDFAKCLLKAIDYFGPEERYKITSTIHQSLCRKFVAETHDFRSVLRWTSVAVQHSISQLQNMVSSLIVNKFYFKWHETFPEAERNTGNLLFCEVFGAESDDNEIFDEIDDIYQAGILTKVILT